MRINFALKIVVIYIFLSISAYADIYKYVDDEGVTHFTNVPAGKDYKRIIEEKNTTNAKNDYNQIIRTKSKKYRIEPSIIRAVITAESNWDPKAVSEKGAIGLMQLMPSTAEDMMINNPFDPEQNIEGGTRYLRLLLDKFNGDLDLALAAYNAGPTTVERSGGVPSITETRSFVRNVISLYRNRSGKTRIYKVIYEDGTVLYTNTPQPYKKHKLSNF